MLRALLLAALFVCAAEGITQAQCVPAQWFPKTESFATIAEIQGQGPAGSELQLEEDGKHAIARLSDYRGSATPVVTKLQGTIESNPVDGGHAICAVKLSGKDNRGPVKIEGEITPHYFMGTITRRIGKDVFSYRLSLKRRVSTEQDRVAALQYGFNQRNGVAYGRILGSASVPGMIRMPLQNSERAIDLLQKNHASQFMRQGHLS